MKKVFIIHGFEGEPNGSWKSWLMVELDKRKTYAFSLSMPTPSEPKAEEWVKEIKRFCDRYKNDEIYLVGHSLGASAIYLYLQEAKQPIAGAILVSGPIEENKNKKIANFFSKPFDFKKIKANSNEFVIIHGDNDPYVPIENAKRAARELNGKLVVIENGQHLNGSAGWFDLPQLLEKILKMMN